MLAVGLTALVPAGAGSLAGCGGLAPSVGLPANDQLVTPATIAAQPAGSPQRALMAWWRDVQFVDQIGYLDGLAPQVAGRELQQNVAGLYLALLSSQLQPARLAIVSVQQHDKSATVYSNIVTRQAIGNERYVTTTRPQAFAMAQIGGQWRLLDDYFIRVTVDRARS